MRADNDAHEIKPFPAVRRLVIDSAYIASLKHPIQALFEIDVTQPRTLLSEHKARTGSGLSFTAYALACLGQAINENRAVHAYRDWRNRLVIFEEVDVVIAIEIPLGDEKFPLVHILRGVNKRSFLDLHDEIRSVQAAPERSQEFGLLKRFASLPGVVRHLAYRLIAVNPRLQKRYAGTVGLTSLGMFTTRSGWGLGLSGHNLALILASAVEKPVVLDGSIQARLMLPVTISYNHDVVDGAPAARFAQRFADLMESGEVLTGIL